MNFLIFANISRFFELTTGRNRLFTTRLGILKIEFDYFFCTKLFRIISARLSRISQDIPENNFTDVWLSIYSEICSKLSQTIPPKIPSFFFLPTTWKLHLKTLRILSLSKFWHSTFYP